MEPSHTLLSLPLEVREQIYTQLLSINNNREPLPDDRARWTFDLRIYRTCKQVYEEARAVFRRENAFVRVDALKFPEAHRNVEEVARVPLLALGRAAERFEPCQLRCVIDVNARDIISRGSSISIMALQDFPAFCKMWYYFDLSHQGLNGNFDVTLILATNEHDEHSQQLPLALQRRLVAPFGMIKGLARFTMKGPHAEEVASELRTVMTTPHASPGYCLEESTRLKDEGNAALNAGNPKLALKLYVDAFAAIHVIIEGRRRAIWGDAHFGSHVSEGVFKNQHAGLVRMTLRIRLVANTLMAYLKLEEYEEAYFWGMRSVNLMRDAFGSAADEPRPDFVGANEWGKIYFRTALAAKEIGEMGEARALLKIAGDWLPRNKRVATEIEEWGTLRLG